MYQKIFTVYDKKAAAYLPPFFMRTDAEAMRAVQMSAPEGSPFARNPSDYQLVVIGEWDDLTGVVTPLAVAVIAEVSHLLRGEPYAQARTMGSALVKTALSQEEQLDLRDRFEQEAG